MATQYLDKTGLSHFWSKIKTYVTNAVKVTGVKGNAEGSYRTGNVNLTPANIGAAPSSHTHRSSDISWVPYKNSPVNDRLIMPMVTSLRANRFAFLPADQIIIEKTTDGGSTWVDAGYADSTKAGLFSETRAGVSIPLLNGVKSLQCGLRITFTAMKYNVPSGTPETNKYQYWSSSNVLRQERYAAIEGLYFWVSTNSDTIRVKLEAATGAAPNNWSTRFENNSFALTGWSGNDFISFSYMVFGGGTNQIDQFWNYRLTFMTRGVGGGETMATSSTTSSQSIMEIRGYGPSWWGKSNEYMASDHLYSWDKDQNATFPAQITATQFNGPLNGSASKVNNHTVNSDVPANAVFTDTTYTPSDATPLMNGTATSGTSAKYAREGHVHPSDTTKVDKVTGKGLSTNDYTTTEKNKLGGIAEGAEVNQNAYSNVWAYNTDGNVLFSDTANAKTDTVYLLEGDNVTLESTTLNLGGESVPALKMSSTDTTYSNATQSAAGLMSAADKKALDLSHYGTCSVATAVKTVACTNFVLTAGAWIAVKFTATNTAGSFTLNVNSTGAKSVSLYGSSSGLANKFLSGHTYLFIYDGSSYWQTVGDIDSGTTYSTMTQANADAGTATTGMLIPPKVLSDTIEKRAEYVAGDTLSITTGMICQGTVSGATNTLSFFVPFSKVCKATSCSCTKLSLLVRSYDGIPYARSGSSGGTYTQLGSAYVSVWENGATKRTKEVNSITCTPQENGMMVQISWGYNLTKASGNTSAVTPNRPAAVSIQGTFTFS